MVQIEKEKILPLECNYIDSQRKVINRRRHDKLNLGCIVNFAKQLPA
jgi:hypothetical protein